MSRDADSVSRSIPQSKNATSSVSVLRLERFDALAHIKKTKAE